MKNLSAVVHVFLISGVIHSIDADRTLPEILTQVCASFKFLVDWSKLDRPI